MAPPCPPLLSLSVHMVADVTNSCQHSSVASKTASGSIVYRLGTPSDKRLSFNLNFSNPKAMISSVASGVCPPWRLVCPPLSLTPCLCDCHSVSVAVGVVYIFQFVKNILGSSSVKKAIGVIPLIDVDSHLEVRACLLPSPLHPLHKPTLSLLPPSPLVSSSTLWCRVPMHVP